MCRVCGAESRHQFSHLILGKYSCSYFYCDGCGFLQTEEPYWLEEAYKSAIAYEDTGTVYRSLRLSRIISPLLFFLYGREKQYLDVAGGYGMLTRVMRDIGFDYYWSDIYCQNLLAQGFESTSTKPPFTAISAFEVLEHVINPVEFIADSLKQAGTGTIIFTTEVFYYSPPKPNWWYYAFESGQHISFYQHRTFQAIGDKLGLNYLHSGSLHILTDKRVSRTLYRLLANERLGPLIWRCVSPFMTTKTFSDQLKNLNELSVRSEDKKQ